MNIRWKEVCKFLSGAFFVTAGASWYFWCYQISVSVFGLTMTPKFLGIRGFIHFALFFDFLLLWLHTELRMAVLLRCMSLHLALSSHSL